MSLQRSKTETEQFERGAIVAALSWLCDPLRTMENFKIGDTVELKSGGPIMTVSMIGLPGGTVQCAWFEGTTLKHGTFPPAALKPATPDEPFVGIA